MSKRCQGLKVDGKPCTSKTSRTSGYCWRHDKSYVPKNSKATSNAKFEAVIARLKDKLGLADTIPKPVTSLESYILRTSTSLARLGVDIYPHIDGAVPFPRRVWQIIGWYLEDEPRENGWSPYDALAMTCKTLYTTLCQDKIWHYRHPLQTRCILPSLFKMPLYRIVTLEVPDGFGRMLLSYNLPSVEDVMAMVAHESGEPQSELHALQREGDVVQSLMEEVFKKSLYEDEDFDEEVEGAGMFSDPKSDVDLTFLGQQPKLRLIVDGKAMMALMWCPDSSHSVKVHVRMTRLLVGYDRQRVTRLMKLRN